MSAPFSPGEAVQTAFGKGTVLEVRNNGRLLVAVRGRALVVRQTDVSRLTSVNSPVTGAERPTRRQGDRTSPRRASGSAVRAPIEVDLHGMTVEEALIRATRVLSDAMLADEASVRFIHGKSGGRIRGALHRHLQGLPGVTGFGLDLRNDGVTVVML